MWIGRKPGSVNRLAPLLTSTLSAFLRQMLSFDTLRGGVHHQDDVINQDLRELVSTLNPIKQHTGNFKFHKW